MDSDKTIRPHIELKKSDLDAYKRTLKIQGKTVNEAINDHVKAAIGDIKPQSIDVPRKFWCGEYVGYESCCYNHFIGLPEKDGVKHPIYPYEESILADLEQHQFIAIMKATGLGITEFLLRYAEWKCLTEYNQAQIVILTGPRIDTAKMQIKRMDEHLKDKIPYQATDYEIRLKGNLIKCFPSMNIDAARSLPNPKLILIDEAAFFNMVEDHEVRAIAERYQAKSNAQVVIYSTPGVPDGMFYDLMKENPSQYHKIKLFYTEGLIPHPTKPELTIFDPKKINEAMKSPSFQREYNLQWGYGWGDVYNLGELNNCIKEYALKPMGYTEMALDPGYGSSKFGILIWQNINGKMQVLYEHQLVRPNQSDALRLIRLLFVQYNVRRLHIDSNNPELIAEFSNEIDTTSFSFRQSGLDALSISANLVRDQQVEIHPKFEELIRQMRSAKRDSKNGDLDKAHQSLDLVDCFRMACFLSKRGANYGVLVTNNGVESRIKHPSIQPTTEPNVVRREINLSKPRYLQP